MKLLIILRTTLCLICSHGLWACLAYAQSPGSDFLEVNHLPSAPVPQAVTLQTDPGAYAGSRPRSEFQTESSGMQTSAENPTSLSLKQAEALALKNNPMISVSRLTALASQQVAREVRSNLWPTATANLTSVDSRDNSRITAGGLNNPIIYERAAAGVSVSQLLTDFGRTKNLAASASLSAKAEKQNAIATKEQICW